MLKNVKSYKVLYVALVCSETAVKYKTLISYILKIVENCLDST